ncbi:MAG: STAS domain-containing protein [Actinomycetota bacterium]|nr:STAS domain-containing protein [Actinomycetota bacterium]
MQIATVRPGAEVRLAGRLDVTGASDARVALHAAVESGSGDLVVDVAGVELVDATGLGVLVGAHRRAQRAGRVLVLRDPGERLRRVLAVTRLDRALRVERATADL